VHDCVKTVPVPGNFPDAENLQNPSGQTQNNFPDSDTSFHYDIN